MEACFGWSRSRQQTQNCSGSTIRQRCPVSTGVALDLIQVEARTPIPSSLLRADAGRRQAMPATPSSPQVAQTANGSQLCRSKARRTGTTFTLWRGGARSVTPSLPDPLDKEGTQVLAFVSHSYVWLINHMCDLCTASPHFIRDRMRKTAARKSAVYMAERGPRGYGIP